MSSTRDKFAALYAALMAAADTGAPVRVPLRQRPRNQVAQQIRRHLADRGYRVAIERAGDTLVCRVERAPLRPAFVPEYSDARVYTPDGALLRVIPALDLARRGSARTNPTTTAHLIPRRDPANVRPAWA